MSGDGKTACPNILNVHNKGLICLSGKGCRLDRQKEIPGSRLTGCADPMLETAIRVCKHGERDDKLNNGASRIYNCKKKGGECADQVTFGNGMVCRLPLEKSVMAESPMA